MVKFLPTAGSIFGYIYACGPILVKFPPAYATFWVKFPLVALFLVKMKETSSRINLSNQFKLLRISKYINTSGNFFLNDQKPEKIWPKPEPETRPEIFGQPDTRNQTRNFFGQPDQKPDQKIFANQTQPWSAPFPNGE